MKVPLKLPQDRAAREWLVIAGAFVLVFLVLSQFSSAGRGGTYLTTVLFTMAIYALFALGLSLQFGQGGLLNFGHVAFMAVGGYAVALLPQHLGGRVAPAIQGWSLGGVLVALLFGAILAFLLHIPLGMLARRFLKRMAHTPRLALAWSLAALGAVAILSPFFPLTAPGATDAVVWLSALAGMAVAAAAALLLGLPAVRLREDYLAIVTIGAAEIFRAFTQNEEWLTGGTRGILRLERPIVDFAQASPWFRDLAASLEVRPVILAHTLAALALLALVYMLLETLARSPWGRMLKAIREDEEVAAALGKNVTLAKLQILMIGSALAALTGALLVWNLSNIYPTHFLSVVTFTAFIILVMGGIGNHRGAILGAIILWGIYELAGNLTILDRYGLTFAGPVQAIFVGVVLILVMMFRPHGALGKKEELVLGK